MTDQLEDKNLLRVNKNTKTAQKALETEIKKKI